MIIFNRHYRPVQVRAVHSRLPIYRAAYGDGLGDVVIRSVNATYNLGFTKCRAMLSRDNIRFSCAIPLSHIFVFCRDIREVIFGAKHTVVLVRKGDDHDAIWLGAGVDDASKVNITKLSVWMPVLTPSFSEEQKVLSLMNEGGRSLLSWFTVTTDTVQSTVKDIFTWHIASQQGVSAPRHIFVALQNNDRVGSQERTHMIFDKLDITEVSLRIKGHHEPSEDMSLSFTHNHVTRAYHRLLTLPARNVNIDTGLQISQFDFTTLYPIYYFPLEHPDLSKQTIVDMHFRAHAGNPPVLAAGPPVVYGPYRAIAVILSDKAMLLEGISGRMSVVDAPVENMSIIRPTALITKNVIQSC